MHFIDNFNRSTKGQYSTRLEKLVDEVHQQYLILKIADSDNDEVLENLINQLISFSKQAEKSYLDDNWIKKSENRKIILSKWEIIKLKKELHPFFADLNCVERYTNRSQLPPGYDELRQKEGWALETTELHEPDLREKNSTDAKVIHYTDLPLISETNLGKLGIELDKWLAYVQILEQSQAYERVDLVSAELLEHLTKAELYTSFKELNSEVDLWRKRLHALIKAQTHAHLGLRRACVPNIRLGPLLNAGVIINLFDLKTHKAGRNSEMFKICLLDPYLDLGVHGLEMQQLLARWDEQGEGENSYLNKPSALGEEAFIYLALMIGPHFLTGSDYSRYENSKRDSYLEEQNTIRRKMWSFDGTQPLSVHPDGKTKYKIAPLDITIERPVIGQGVYRDGFFADEVSSAMTNWGQQRQPIASHEIRSRIVEAVVACHSSGAGLDGSNQNLRNFRYQGWIVTQRSIQDEGGAFCFKGVSPELSKRLQLMQTAPDDRVRNTLLLFADQPQLLEHYDWQRVIELNCFRGGFLAEHLQKAPHFEHELVTSIRKLAEHCPSPIPFSFWVPFITQIAYLSKNAEIQLLSKNASTRLHERLKTVEIEILSANKVAKEYVDEIKALLFSQSILQNDEIPLDDLYVRYFYLIRYGRKAEREDELATIRSFFAKNWRKFSCSIKEEPAKLTHALQFIFSGEGIKWEQLNNSPIWMTKGWTIDLIEGYCSSVDTKKAQTKLIPSFVLDELEGYLYKEAIQNPIPSRLFSGNLIGFSYDGPKGTIRCYYSLITRKVLLFKKIDDQWFERTVLKPEVKDQLPDDLCSCTMWACKNNGNVLFEDELGRVRYKATISSNKLAMLQCSIQGEFFFCQQANNLHFFNKLSDDKNILVTREQIYYTSLNFSYVWNNGRWCSSRFPGYHLVSSYLSHFTTPMVKRSNSIAIASSVFPFNFQDYHILISASGATKLVLSSKEGQLYSYTVNREKGVVFDTTEGGLYLVFLLASKKQYTQALLALKEVMYCIDVLDDKAYSIIEKIIKLEDSAVDFRALKIHLLLMKQNKEEQALCSEQEILSRESEIYSLLKEYTAYLTEENQTNPALRLTKKEKNRFKYLFIRSPDFINEYLFSYFPPDVKQLLVFNNFLSALINWLKSDEHELEFKETLELILTTGQNRQAIIDACTNLAQLTNARIATIRTRMEAIHFAPDYLAQYQKIGLFNVDSTELDVEKRKLLMQWALDIEIASRLKELPPIREHLYDNENTVVSSFEYGVLNFAEYLSVVVLNTDVRDKIVLGQQQLTTAFLTQATPLAKQLAEHLAQDTESYMQQLSGEKEQTLKNDETKLNHLRQRLIQRIEELRHNLEEKTKNFCNYFLLPEQGGIEDPVVQDLFQQARWAFAQNDWSSFVERGIIGLQFIDSCVIEMKNYLLEHIEYRQMLKIFQQLQTYLRDKDDAEAQKLTKLLQQKRYYDVNTDPHAASLLMLEDELEIICDENQVRHFKDMTHHKTAFKHEAWGGGKTTVLRHLIAKEFADGAHLSSLLTHAPLMTSHHQQLKETTTRVYGQEAIRLDFTREAPTDGLALRIYYLKMIRCVQEKGRTDQTMNSLMSLRHAYSLKILETNFEGDSQQLEKSLDELRVFSELLRFRQDRMVVGSDEIDKLLTPASGDNYAIGAAEYFPLAIYEAAKQFLRFIDESEFKYYFKSANPCDLPDSERFYIYLRERVSRELAVAGLNSSVIAQALLPVKEGQDNTAIKTAYSQVNTYLTEEMKKRFAAFETLLLDVVPLSLKTRVGVHFGRAADGISTKPYADSGECQERSQHSSLFVQAWYSCLDYYRLGVNEKTVAAYVQRLKEKSQTEVRNNRTLLKRQQSIWSLNAYLEKILRILK